MCRLVDRWNGRFCLSLNLGSAVLYKLNAQSLRLFGLHDDVNDAQRAGANRLQTNKQSEQAQRERIHLCSRLGMKDHLHQECYPRSCREIN